MILPRSLHSLMMMYYLVRYGAAPDSWFSHLAVEVPAEEGSNEWLEAVDEAEYISACSEMNEKLKEGKKE